MRNKIIRLLEFQPSHIRRLAALSFRVSTIDFPSTMPIGNRPFRRPILASDIPSSTDLQIAGRSAYHPTLSCKATHWSA
jgi:hypothetical protein